MIIEKPELYIIGRCRANDEQIMYIKPKIQDIIGMQPIYTTDNVKIQDNLSYFHGDGPAAQFECGNQKLDHYFCVSCNVSSFMIEDFAHCGYQKIVDLKDRLMKTNEGHWARKHTLKEKLHPSKELNKQEIIEELISRKICDIDINRKCEIEKILKKEMRGIQHVPSLLYHNPSINFLNKHLAKYEISSIEPMHDICGHIKNIFTELPSVLKENEKNVFNEIYQITIGNKQCTRACDYRLALLDIVLVMKNILQPAILELLLTLVEIQRICYSPEKERTSKQILKLYNITFKHVYIMKNLFRKVNKTSWGKLYGKCFHQIICHGPQQYRLVSGTASNCEAEERVFNTIQGITNTTSSRHPSHIINNIILRCQVEENQQTTTDNKSNEISKEYSCFGNLSFEYKNTEFEKDFIQKYCNDWQCHLERISDYIVLGANKWWVNH